MTEQEILDLWKRNKQVIALLETTAATVVKTIILAAEKPENGPAFVELAFSSDNSVTYTNVEGEDAVIKKCCEALGGQWSPGQITIP